MPLLVALTLGILLSVAAGANLRLLEDAPLRRPLLLIGLFVAQGLSRGRLLGDGAEIWSIPLWGTVSLVLTYFAFESRTRGLAVLACGTLMNLLVVLLNGYMPVVTGQPSPVSQVVADGFYRAAGAASTAIWLGDVLPMRLFSWTYYLSAGDVLLAVGVVVFLLEVTTIATPDSDLGRDAQVSRASTAAAGDCIRGG